MDEVSTLMESGNVLGPIVAAAHSLTDEASRPTTKLQYVSLRNALIVHLTTECMRRALEFTCFKLQEYNQRSTRLTKEGDQLMVIQIGHHKTGQKGK